MLELLQPALLLPALAGLLVPLLIHLWERRQGKRVLIGSLRWLEVAEDRRISRMRFSEWWRFLLRVAIIGGFALLLTQPFRRQTQAAAHRETRWVLVDPTLRQDPVVRPALDSLQSRGIAARLLTTGFPGLQEPVDTASATGYWSLLRELATRPDAPDTVLIIAQPRLRQFYGPRPALPFIVEWVSPGSATTLLFPVAAWGDEAIRLLLAQSSSEGTRFLWQAPARIQAGSLNYPDFPSLKAEQTIAGNWQVILGKDTVPVQPSPQPQVQIVYDPDYKKDQEVLSAALRAAGRYIETEIRIESLPLAGWSDTSRTDWLFWLSRAPLPATSSSKVVKYRPDTITTSTVFDGRYDSPFLLRLPLAAGTASLEAGDRLPRALIGLLFPSSFEIAAYRDQRHLPEEQLLPSYCPQAPAKDPEKKESARSLHFIFWLIIVALFLFERLWPGFTKQAAS